MAELKGHEEPQGFARPLGAKHGAEQAPHDLEGGARGRGADARLRDAALRVDHRRRPGRHRAGRAAAPARRADDHRREERAARRQLAQPLQVALPARPGLVRPPALPAVPAELAGLRARRTRSATGWRCTRGSWSSTTGPGRRPSRRHYDEAKKEWTVVVDRDGEEVTLRPKQLVFATGMSGKPNMPKFPGMDDVPGRAAPFLAAPRPRRLRGQEGAWSSARTTRRTTSAAALWEDGADVTMVQRSSTHIVRSDTLMDIGLGALYSEQAVDRRIDHPQGGPDLRLAALPDPARVPDPALRRRCSERDADFYGGLEKAGFRLDWGADDSGLFMKYLRRGSGYYIDVGASQLVIDGKIKLKRGQVAEITETGVKLDDGDRAAGRPHRLCHRLRLDERLGGRPDQPGGRRQGRQGLGPRLGHAEGSGPWEGEQRNMWKPTQQEALWFHGGNLHQSRHYSQYLAPAAEGAHGGHPDAGLRAAGGAPSELTVLALKRHPPGRRLRLCPHGGTVGSKRGRSPSCRCIDLRRLHAAWRAPGSRIGQISAPSFSANFRRRLGQ